MLVPDKRDKGNMNKRSIGTHYEEIAADYLSRQGIRIIDRNVFCGKIGEIDLIGIESAASGRKEDAVLIFFEVKYRKNHDYGYPIEAIDHNKQRRMRRCAEYYLMKHRFGGYCRFDAIAIEGEQITWVKNIIN